MPLHMEKGPFCQSCAMPLSQPDEFGTDASGTRVNDYCTYCYQGGVFTEPDITMVEMIDKGVGIMSSRGIMPESEARGMLTAIVPRLRRWHMDSYAPAGPEDEPRVW